MLIYWYALAMHEKGQTQHGYRPFGFRIIKLEPKRTEPLPITGSNKTRTKDLNFTFILP